MYIAISGNLGSGKTTVARGLATAFNCDLYPRRSYNTSYIEDLFREPARWTTEAQISFMVHKYDEIRNGLERGRLFVLDRTFDEEVRVFAQRFHDDGTIDHRSMDLIRQLASDLRTRLEPPALIVFCDCPVSVCEERLAGRPRNYQMSYPPAHLSLLDRRLQAWASEQRGVRMIRVATDRTDFEERENVAALARAIDAELTATRGGQLELFGEESEWAASADALERRSLGQGTRQVSLLRGRQVYLAAPFTRRAKRREFASPADPRLFVDAGYAESIPPYYKRQLTALARAIESHGHDVLLPHRDINRWGSRALPAREIARRCLRAIATADCFVGLIAESFGSHSELGYALGLGKPALVLTSETEPTSFFGTGMAELAGVASLRASSFKKLTASLRATDPLPLMKEKNEGW
jgi:deoxyadenosine/deoxycytidine kinase/nucleoside 2-deoxyribosyltransferase